VLTSKCPCSEDQRTFVALEVCSCEVFGTTSIRLETSRAEVAFEGMGIRILVCIQSILGLEDPVVALLAMKCMLLSHVSLQFLVRRANCQTKLARLLVFGLIVVDEVLLVLKTELAHGAVNVVADSIVCYQGVD